MRLCSNRCIADDEIFARSRRSFQNAGVGRLGVPVINPSPLNKGICVFVCLVPLAIGFGP